MINREALLGSKDCKVHPISIPEWGGDSYIKTFSGKCRAKLDDYISSISGDMTTEQALRLMAKAIIYALCDEKGNELLKEEDVECIEGKSIEAITRVFEAVAEKNGLQVSKAKVEAEKKS